MLAGADLAQPDAVTVRQLWRTCVPLDVHQPDLWSRRSRTEAGPVQQASRVVTQRHGDAGQHRATQDRSRPGTAGEPGTHTATRRDRATPGDTGQKPGRGQQASRVLTQRHGETGQHRATQDSTERHRSRQSDIARQGNTVRPGDTA